MGTPLGTPLGAPLKGVLLDSISLGNLDLSPLNNLLDSIRTFPTSEANNIVSHIADADIVLTNKAVITQQVMAACPNIKFIGIMATGTNNVDLAAAKNHNIVVCNATGYGTASVVQHTMALMLALSTNLMPYHQDVKQGRWQQSPIFTLLNRPIVELNGKTLGIVGYGELGSGVAQVAKAFGMNILIARRDHQDPRPGRISLEDLLGQSDYVSLHCPLTNENKHLINRNTLQLMKPSAFLINTARGALVNAGDLAWALKNRIISGAALDVLEYEPPERDHPLIDAEDVPNLIITPHNAWGAIESRQRLLAQTIENIEAFLSGSIIRRVS